MGAPAPAIGENQLRIHFRPSSGRRRMDLVLVALGFLIFAEILAGTPNAAGTPSPASSPAAPKEYAVVFAPKGLPAGVPWSVTVGGVTGQAIADNPITFYRADGKYTYQIGPVSGWSTASAGSFAVAGERLRITVTFTLVRYAVTLREENLPSGTTWSVSVDGGKRVSSDGATLRLSEPNGTYQYAVSPIRGWSTTGNGSFIVAGSPETVSLVFLATTGYLVEFAESDLPTGTAWSVSIDSGSTFQSTGTTLNLTEPNGSYDYAIGQLPNWTAPEHGSFVVAGSPVNISVVFTPQPTVGWEALNITSPSNRSDYAFAWATPENATPYGLLFGGRNATGSGFVNFNDTWLLQNGTWTNVTSTPSPPASRYPMMAWDAADNYMLLFGGSDNRAYLNDTWYFELGSGWHEVFPAVSPPARRSGAMVWDAADGYVLLWGGHNSTPGTGISNQTTYTMMNDTWSYLHGQWTQIETASAPEPASEPSLAYDALTGTVVEFGGYDQFGTVYQAEDQTWNYHGGVWTNLSLPLAPSSRDGAATAFDPAMGGVAIAGGQNENGIGGPHILNDTWVLEGSNVSTLHWVELSLESSFTPLDSAQMVYDTSDGELYLFGGIASSPLLHHLVCFGTTYALLPLP